MKVDLTTGRIAYHAYLLREGGGLDYVQYGFDGEIESSMNVRSDRVPMELSNNP